MHNFPITVSGEPSLQHIFPTKQKAAKAAIELAKADERICRLIVFGSAVTMNCGAVSDIDIALDIPGVSEEEFSKIARKFYLEVPSEVDIVHYNGISSPLLKHEIDTKGVDIYVKRS